MAPELLLLVGMINVFTPADPPKLGYSTYLPGPVAIQTVVDRAGYQYFTMESMTGCEAEPSYRAGSPVQAVFVGRLEREGQELRWVACVEGSYGALTRDSLGALYVGTNADGWMKVTKLAPETFERVYEARLEGGTLAGLAVDKGGSVYATGAARAGLRPTAGAYRAECRREPCGFVAKFDRSGRVGYVTYLQETGSAIAVDSRGEVWTTGTLTSRPVGPPYYEPTFTMAFVSKLDAEGGKQLRWLTLGGGIAFRVGKDGGGLGVAVDGEDAAYVTGYGSFVPTTPGTILPINPTLNGRLGYLLKLGRDGGIVYGTYLKGIETQGVAVDDAGNAIVSIWGNTLPQSINGVACGWSAYATVMMMINRDGTKVLSSRVVGGRVRSLALTESGAVYVSGETMSSAFVTTPGAYQPEYSWEGATEVQGGRASAFAATVDFSQPAEPTLTCVANAASGRAGRNSFGVNGSVAPGEVVTIRVEPFEAVGEVQVTFDGLAAPVLSSGANEITAVVPFGVSKSQGGYTELSISVGSSVAGPYRLPVARAAPGAFRKGSEVAAFHADGSVNSASNPARPGSVVTIFLTGAGVYEPPMEDGSMGPSAPPFPAPVLPVRVLIWGINTPRLEAPVLFAGQAPNLIAGVLQVNLQVPESLPPGPAGMVVRIGDFSTDNMRVWLGGQ